MANGQFIYAPGLSTPRAIRDQLEAVSAKIALLNDERYRLVALARRYGVSWADTGTSAGGRTRQSAQ